MKDEKMLDVVQKYCGLVIDRAFATMNNKARYMYLRELAREIEDNYKTLPWCHSISTHVDGETDTIEINIAAKPVAPKFEFRTINVRMNAMKKMTETDLRDLNEVGAEGTAWECPDCGHINLGIVDKCGNCLPGRDEDDELGQD